jgi:methionyl-tRNA formyltransferase
MVSDAGEAVSVVFVCAAGSVSGRVAENWARTGQSLAAVVVSETRPGKPLPGPFARLARSGVPVVRAGDPADWSGIEARLEGVAADVLVCYGFMRLIPGSFLQRFRCGGVNFHPALLPAYRGPHPTRCLVADVKVEAWGGLTLHTMTDVFDEGAILAQARFLTQDYFCARRFEDVLVSTMLAAIREVLPLHCRGLVAARPQEGGAGGWAVYHPRSVIATSAWSADEVAMAGAFLARRKGIFLRLDDGRLLRVAGMRRTMGPPNGGKAVVGLATVEFDCRDARVSVFRPNRPGRLAQRLHAWAGRLGRDAAVRQLLYERVDDPAGGMGER